MNIDIVQFGEGNFLRTFVDLYFDTLNKEGNNNYKINIVKPIPFGDLSKFQKQNNKYHVVLRGQKDGKVVEEPYFIESLNSVISPFEDYDKFLALASLPDLKIIVSNTTEAGIKYVETDKFDDFIGISYPAKLTKFLLERYKKGLGNLYLLPVELIDNNAKELFSCVDKYISLWNLGEDFRDWNNKNYYCSTLVDRIVSGYPKDKNVEKHLFELIKEEDHLLSIGEPFGLWVIENKGDLKQIIKDGHHNIDVLLTEDISYYKKRKVRVLNGSHTNMVPISLWHGKETVYDCLKDEKIRSFIFDTLENDIIPFVSDNIGETEKFANQVIERFENPFLNHELTSIALNSISKWKARDLPSFLDYYHKNSSLPKYLLIGFAYLIKMYQSIYEKDGKFYVDLVNKTIEVKDDAKYLVYFNNHDLHDFLSDTTIWDMDLTLLNNLEDEITQLLSKINKGISLI